MEDAKSEGPTLVDGGLCASNVKDICQGLDTSDSVGARLLPCHIIPLSFLCLVPCAWWVRKGHHRPPASLGLVVSAEPPRRAEATTRVLSEIEQRLAALSPEKNAGGAAFL